MADLAAASFVDEATLHAKGGRGGNGSVSFRRESHVPRGGPDGGDGGNGGDVVLVADTNTSSLLDLHRLPHRRGGNGQPGEGQRKDGATGDDVELHVPPGTLVRDHASGQVVADLVADGQRWVASAGGRGGRGNASFANRHRRIPAFAERGEEVAEQLYRLELQVIADVGLVGYPSAGKSSLVARLSAATPRIEAWPFTTLTPHLGVMRGGDDGQGNAIDVVLADVPGLVAGAAEGRGLGHQFLRHIQRCHVLLHVLDGAPFDPERDPATDLAALRHELEQHDPSLLERPQLVVINKVDLPDAQAAAELYADQLADEEVLLVSTITGEGLDALRYRLGAMVAEQRRHAIESGAGPRSAVQETSDELVVIVRPRQDFVVTLEQEGLYRVAGATVERWVQMLPLDNPEAARHLQGRLFRAGVDKALARAGARTGDDVVIGDVVFEYEPDLDHLPPDERQAVLDAETAALEMAEAGHFVEPGEFDAAAT